MALNGFFKIDRKILEWQWFKDNNTLIVWIWLLASVNFSTTHFMGEEIKPGEVPTSIEGIATGTNLSPMKVRTALKHLKLTGEITSRTRSKYQVITVVNWEKYQSVTSKLTGKQQADNRQITGKQQADNNTVRKKEYKKERKKEYVCVTHPTRGDTEAYFAGCGRSVEDAHKFFNYNEALGWKIGKTPIENWQSAADMWMKQKPDSAPVQNDDGLDDFGRPRKREFQ